jgi:Ca-activated chloride channel family protein
MTFLWMEMLLLLLLIPVLIAAYILSQKRRQKYAIRYSSLSLVKQALGKGPGIRRHIPPAFFIAAMTVLIFALARPATLLLPSLQGTIILAMDSSGSMRADDVKPTRMDAAKAAARSFVEKHAKNSRIGVVAFGGSANLVQPPTKDRDLVLAAIDRLIYQRGTAIGSGILASLNAILEEFGEKQILPYGGGDQQSLPDDREGPFLPAIIVLLSDGQSNTGPLPLEMAAQAYAKGVRIYTVGLGSPDGTILNFYNMSIRVRLDEETLKRIADKTDGAYFKADSETELENIYSNLGTKLVFKQEKTEITALFAAFAAVLFIAAGSLSLLWFNRLP